MNLATRYLQEHNETLDDYDGVCGELAAVICKRGDAILYVEGDIPWRYHMVLLHKGHVHDAWCEGEALPPRDYLVTMFGADTWVEVSVDGLTVFEGECQDYIMDAVEVYARSDGDLTKRYYAELEKRGTLGIIAVNLFRAQKCSARAKGYRKSSHRSQTYGRKNWSLENLDRELGAHAEEHGIVWGWKQDPSQEFHDWVLYVDLPQGQVSFHSAVRHKGPTYAGDWDGTRTSAERIIAFCNTIYRLENT